MLGRNHSGFGVHHAVWLDADDLAGRERLAQYMLRCPFSLQRMIRVTEQGQVARELREAGPSLRDACRTLLRRGYPGWSGGPISPETLRKALSRR